MQALPIDELLSTITEELIREGALVLKAEPGAGKTTRVPQAVLRSKAALLASGEAGKIILLQARRIAARAAASRIAEELGTALGEEVGYQVRFESKQSRKTRILACTEGIFLRRLQSDPLLEDVAVVIFDEFHERSIDSDISLALAKQVKEQLRPELKLLVMSATLSSEPISKYLNSCPIVECPGRIFPVAIEYLKYPPSQKESLEKLVAEESKRLSAATQKDLLVFLPGQWEIRQTEDFLATWAQNKQISLMTLFGDMSLEEQKKVLLPSANKKIILATNVAETSLTIDGITAVLDSGLARINQFDSKLGMNRLELSKISKASATQRAGRAGRLAEGQCLRLWTEREHFSLPEFNTPEIARVELSECLLQLFLWGESDVRNFDWFERPPEAALSQAFDLLEALDAVKNGSLTELGKRIANLPVQPRLGRLLIEAENQACDDKAVLCAAILADRDPFKRTGSDFKSIHHSNSDVLDRAIAINEFQKTGIREYFGRELQSSTTRQILRARDQLKNLVSLPATAQNPEEALLRSLMTAYPDRICKKREAKGDRAVMTGGRGVKLAPESAVIDAEYFVAVELVDAGKSESLIRVASAIKRDWLSLERITSKTTAYYDETRQRVLAVKRKHYKDLIIEESSAAIPPEIDPGQILYEALLAHGVLDTIFDEDTKQYFARIEYLKEWLPELNLPDPDEAFRKSVLQDWTSGCSSVQEAKERAVIPYIHLKLTAAQIESIDREAPEFITLPTGRKGRLTYQQGEPAILTARIQEFFGMLKTPIIARGRAPLLLHLQAPNYRVQQITPDLESFWNNTYPEIRKELKGRYPKHAWPADPREKPERTNKDRN